LWTLRNVIGTLGCVSMSSTSPEGSATSAADGTDSTTEPSDAPSSPPESSSSTTTDETGPGRSETALEVIRAGYVDPARGFPSDFAKKAVQRFVGDEHYLIRFLEVGHEQAASEACEQYGHAGREKGMCTRCGMDAMTQRQAWLQSRGMA
jgi:hypothetical protein